MRVVDIARRAARSLRNAKTRTILTSLAIAVGAFTITISIAAGEGARQYADKLIGSNISPQALFIVKDKTLFDTGAAQPGIRVYDPDAGATATGLTIKQMNKSDVDAIAAREDLEFVVPVYNPQARYMRFAGDDTLFSSDVSSYDATIRNEVVAGTLPALGKQLAKDDVAVPEAFVDVLVQEGVANSADDLIGKEVTFTISQTGIPPLAQSTEITLTVVAVTKQSALALNGSTAFQIATDQAKFISEYTTKGTPAYQKYLGVTAVAKEGIDPEVVKTELEAQGYFPQTAEDLQSFIFTIVNLLQGIVLGFGVIALIASVFGIINTQYISVLERTREIGLMKALGMRGRHVSRLFQFEAAWIGFLGGIIGAIIAVISGTLANPLITEALSLGEGNYLLVFQVVPIMLMIVGLMLIAMLAGYFPARKAAKLDPIEALRTE